MSFPTETVYGLGADARVDQAVARIYAAKGRPSFNPLIVHLSATDAVADYVDMTPQARKLADAFWPGALTLVLPIKADVTASQPVSYTAQTLPTETTASPQGL